MRQSRIEQAFESVDDDRVRPSGQHQPAIDDGTHAGAAAADANAEMGRFVTVGTIQQISPNPRKAIYAATKSAQANLALSMAKRSRRMA